MHRLCPHRGSLYRRVTGSTVEEVTQEEYAEVRVSACENVMVWVNVALLAAVLVLANLTYRSTIDYRLVCAQGEVENSIGCNHHVCIQGNGIVRKVPKKKVRYRMDSVYVPTRLYTIYRDCSPALSTPIMMDGDVAWYRYIHDTTAAANFTLNRKILDDLQECAKTHGDIMADLIAVNMRMSSNGTLVVVDCTLTPEWTVEFSDDATSLLSGYPNLRGNQKQLERFIGP